MHVEPIKITPRDARQSVRVPGMKYVLIVGISLAVIAFVVVGVWILDGF